MAFLAWIHDESVSAHRAARARARAMSSGRGADEVLPRRTRVAAEGAA